MTTESYKNAPRQKNFYVHLFRRCVSFLLISLVINALFLVGIFYKYITRPEPDYYSTNGITAPVLLTALLQPNFTSKALLKADPVVAYEDKELPS